MSFPCPIKFKHSNQFIQLKAPPSASEGNGTDKGHRCLCGSVHWYSDCYYLVPEKRPVNWTPKAQTEAIVEEAMKNQQVKARVEKSLQRSKSYSIKSKTTTNAANQEKEIGAFTSIKTSSSFSADSYTIRDSWILDNGSNSHVCNRTMKSRYTLQKKAVGEYLIAGTQRLAIDLWHNKNHCTNPYRTAKHDTT